MTGRFKDELARFGTVKELEEYLGDITPEEQALLYSVDLTAAPTPKELKMLGPDFMKRILAKVRERLEH